MHGMVAYLTKSQNVKCLFTISWTREMAGFSLVLVANIISEREKTAGVPFGWHSIADMYLDEMCTIILSKINAKAPVIYKQ